MDDKEFFKQGTIRICGSLDKDKMLSNCYKFFKQFFPLDGIAIGVHDIESETFEFISEFSTFDIVIPDQPLKLNKKANEFITSNQDKVILVHRAEDNPVLKIINKALGNFIMSGIVLTLDIEGERIGVIGFLSGKEKMFNTEHARLVSLLHDPFAIATSNILRYMEVLRLQDLLKDDNKYLYKELRKLSGDEIIGTNFGLKDVMEMVYQVAPIDSKVLILGETGVGKELIASAIHSSSKRRNNPFITLNCGAIPETLIDSELFGHEKGAFTGAVSRQRGRFERAENGTLFLDEIGELPMNAQIRLLRVLESGEFERVGGSEQLKSNVRIIAATNKNLEELVKNGGFREDLLFRLNVFPITIPPLRHRKADIPAFVNYFIDKKRTELNIYAKPEVSRGSLSRLQSHDWPGNIRELENCVERELIKVIARKDNFLKFLDYSENKKYSSESTGFSDNEDDYLLTADELFEIHVKKVLKKTNGKIQGKNGAAAILDLNPSTLRNRLRKQGIPFGKNLN